MKQQFKYSLAISKLFTQRGPKRRSNQSSQSNQTSSRILRNKALGNIFGWLSFSQQTSTHVDPPNIARKRLLRLVLGCILLASLILFFLFGNESLEPSILTKAPRMITTPGGDNQRNSDRYQETVKLANIKNVERVADTDESYILIPEAVPELVEGDELSLTLPWTPNEYNFGDTNRVEISIPDVSQEKILNTNKSIENLNRDTFTQAILAELNHSATEDIPQSNGSERNEAIPPTQDRVETSLDTIPITSTPISSRYNIDGTNPYTQSILDQMNAITRSMVINAPQSMTLIENSTNQPNPTTVDSDRNQSEVRTEPNEVIAAGSILYGHIIVGVSSELATPILAEISLGTYKGWRLVGRFNSNAGQNGLVVEFNTMVDPAGQEYSINALAIDGLDGESIIASEVDQRLIQRYGPVFAASFISGLASGLATPRQSIATIGDNPVVVTEEPTRENSFYAGIRSGVDTMLSDLVANSPNGPVVSINPGHPIGIVFTSSFVHVAQ